MKPTRLVPALFVAGAAAVLVPQGAAAVVVDDFESYTPGWNLHGQGGWHGWDNRPSSGTTVSTSFARSGRNSMLVSGPTDMVRTFGGLDRGEWVLSLWQYIPSSASGTGYFILLNEYADNGPYGYSVQIRNDFNAGKVTSDLSLVGPATLSMVKDAWVEYRFEIDLTMNSVAEYYDGQLLSTHPWQDGGLNVIQAVDLCACGSGAVYYDDLQLVQVPEPATLAFAGAGIAALFALCRRCRPGRDS